MAWRDRLRRRAAGPTTADGTSGAAADRSAPDAGALSAPDAGGSSVPGDWDGGWRRTPPPRLTVSRAPLGVSDGLAFRAGLAAWQNPSFDSGLGHAVLPTAPTGLVRGVTRPAAPQATGGGGGPLLLRSLRVDDAEGPQGDGADAGVVDTRAAAAGGRDAGASGGTPRPPTARAPRVARRTRPGGRASTTGSSGAASASSGAASGTSGAAPGVSRAASAGSGTGSAVPGAGSAVPGAASSGAVPAGGEPVVGRPGRDGATGGGRAGDAPRERGLTSGSSPAVLSSAPPAVQRTAEPGTGPVVPPADADRGPTVPEIPLVRRVAAVPSATADGAPARPAADRPAAPRTRSGATGTDSGRASGAGGRAPRSADGPDSGADAPRPSVRPRPAGPALTVARRPADPVRRVPALRPAHPPAPVTRSAPVPPATPAQGAVSRAPLGAPLSELPPTAVPLASGAAVPPGGRGASGPALPVVQRHTDDASGAEGSAPRAGGADRPTRTGARARGGLGAPLPSLPPSAEVAQASAPASGPVPGGRPSRPTVDAPLLGRGGVQRSLAADASGPSTGQPGTGQPGTTQPGTAQPGTAPHVEGPATPVVTPPQPTTVTGSPAPAPAVAAPGRAPREQRRPGTASPGGQRPAAGQSPGAPSGKASPVPLVVARRVAQGAAPGHGGMGHGPSGVMGTRPLPVSRSLSLLAARPLSLNTMLPEGSAPPPARAGSRPVVAARWATTPDAVARTVSSRPATASATGGTAPVRTPAAGPGNAPAVPAGVPGRPAVTGRHETPGAAPGPTGAPAPVQRVPVVRPAPPASRAPGTGAPAASAAVPARALPVTAPQAAPLADRPAAVPGIPAAAGEVPVVRWRRAGSDGGTGGASTPVQRTGPGPRSGTAGDRVPPGVPAKTAPAGGRPRSASAPATAQTPGSASAAGTARGTDPARDAGLDLDDLARRLLDPVARLLRAELRRGRERTGRPHDGRR
ncbi:hypothetical protein [Streptomyces sp. NPDC002644]